MKALLLTCFMFAASFAFSQKFICTHGNGDLSFLSGQKDLNVIFDYSTLSYDSVSNFQEYLKTRPNQAEVTRVAILGMAPIVTTKDGNDAYNHVEFRPDHRTKGEKQFIEIINLTTTKKDLYCSASLGKGKYVLVVKFNEILTQYRVRGMIDPTVDWRLARFFIYFADAETGDVYAELSNPAYEEKWQKVSYKKIAEDLSAYLKKTLK